MDNPGPFQLTENGSAFQIVGPGTIVGDVIKGFEGIDAVSFQAQFLYGSGGTTCTLFIQTSLDQEQTWFDIAAIQFALASGTQVINLSGLTPKTTPLTPSQQVLAPGTSVDGLLGDRFRAVVASTGTYGQSTVLNVTGCAR